MLRCTSTAAAKSSSGIARATEAGELRPLHPVVASSALFGALNTLCRTYDPDGELSLDEMIDATLDLLLNGWSN